MVPPDGLSSAQGPCGGRILAAGVPPARWRPGHRSGTSGARVEHRGAIVLTRRVEDVRGDRRRAGGTRRGNRGRYAEMTEEALDHGRLVDERDQAQSAATPGTGQHVKAERSSHQLCPTLAT